MCEAVILCQDGKQISKENFIFRNCGEAVNGNIKITKSFVHVLKVKVDKIERKIWIKYERLRDQSIKGKG